MRKNTASILGSVIALTAVCALTFAQSSPKRRTPILTNDDLSSTRDLVRPSVEIEERASAGRDPEIVRGTIAWHRDVSRAIELARSQGKLVVADVYTDWCSWCKKMDKTLYSDPAVVSLSRQQVFVKVNAEDGGQGQNFAEQMRVKGYPTTIILDGNGRVLNIAEGYIASPQAFGALLQEARAQVR